VLIALREHFWVARVMEWLPIAGAVALLIRSRRGFLLIVPWFAIVLVAKATYVPASVEDASFWRILMPGYPAYLLLAAAVPLLLPRVRARPEVTQPTAGRRYSVALAAAAAVFVLAPLAVIAANPPLRDGGRKAVILDDSLLPVSSDIDLQANEDSGSVRLRWDTSQSASGGVFYRILRAKAGTDVACAGRRGADQCRLYTEQRATTRATSFVDSPGPGTWTYRVGVSANWLDDPELGDVYVLSEPVTATVP
jgi:hypothetical protein